jgi:hypothetical protein
MVFRTTIAVCVLASGVVADDGWVAVGSTRGANRNVTALSLAVAPDGLPRYAYGFVESEGTEIQLMAFDGKEWVEDYHHVSQYPQTYTDFRYRVAESGSNYLGLRIKCSLAEGCGSVLNSGVEYRGSYAFANQLFDFDLDSKGDMTMLWISKTEPSASYPGTGGALETVQYAQSGWDDFPATNTYRNPKQLDTQEDASPISAVRVQRLDEGTGQVAAVWIHKSRVYASNVLPSSDLKPVSVGVPFQGTAIDMAVGVKRSGRPNLCVAAHTGSGNGEVTVRCANQDGTEGGWQVVGGGAALVGGEETSERAVSLVTTADGGLYVASPMAEGNGGVSTALLVRYLAPGADKWEPMDLHANGEITHYEMSTGGANGAGSEVYVAISEDHGKSLRVYSRMQ